MDKVGLIQVKRILYYNSLLLREVDETSLNVLCIFNPTLFITYEEDNI